MLLAALAAPWVQAVAEEPQTVEVTEAPDAGLQRMTLAEYRGQLARLQDLVASCRSSAAACDAEKIGSDDSVTGDASHGDVFAVRWDWLREAIARSKDAKLAGRGELLDEASRRLDDELREAGGDAGDPASTVPCQRARSEADRVLAQGEFRHVTANPFWERVLGHIEHWLSRLFGGVDSLGRNAPWLGPLIEWGFLALAMAAVLVWVLRVVQRQRLAIRLEAPEGVTRWQEASRNWAALAESAAARGDWRDAIHSLYWASVTELEGRRVWRQNSARTPREYLRLVQPGSSHARPLRQLTQSFEQTWYGTAPAVRGDYDHALALYEELRSA